MKDGDDKGSEAAETPRRAAVMTIVELRGAATADELAAVVVVFALLDRTSVDPGGLTQWRALRRAALAESGTHPHSREAR